MKNRIIMTTSAALAFGSLLLPNISLAQVFSINLTGGQEVPPVQTNARGRFIIDFNERRDAARFQLSVFNGNDVLEAHLHCARPGENGPIIAYLFGRVPGGFDVNGTLSSFILTDKNILSSITGTSTCPNPVTNIATLRSAIMSGTIYANVHTLANPNGEIRGDFRRTATTSVDLRSILRGTDAGDIRRSLVIIRNARDYERLSDELEITLPGVNFAERMVIAAFQGQRPTGGYNISITNVVDRGRFLELTVTETIPGRNCTVTQAQTSPFEIASIQRINKPIILNHEVEETSCR